MEQGFMRRDFQDGSGGSQSNHGLFRLASILPGHIDGPDCIGQQADVVAEHPRVFDRVEDAIVRCEPADEESPEHAACKCLCRGVSWNAQ